MLFPATILTSLILFVAFCVSAQTLLPGDFISNCADGGWFVTQISFNSDKTFNYKCQGDLLHDEANGFFNLVSDTVVLNYQAAKNDTLWMRLASDTLTKDSTLVPFIFPDRYKDARPGKLLMIDQSNLYVLDKDNKIYKGFCYTQKEYYLKRSPYFHIERPQPILRPREIHIIGDTITVKAQLIESPIATFNCGEVISKVTYKFKIIEPVYYSEPVYHSKTCLIEFQCPNETLGPEFFKINNIYCFVIRKTKWTKTDKMDFYELVDLCGGSK